MAKKKMPDYDILDMPQDLPIVLAGQPGNITGELRIYNPGEKRLVLRDIRVTGSPMRAASAETAAPAQPIAPVVLRPGQARDVPLHLAIDPYCPPGEYKCELNVAGSMRQVVLHVTEVVDLEISPSPIVIENRPGATFTKKVIFSNLGNVPLTIGDIGPVLIEDELLECRTGRAALARTINEVETVDAYQLEVLREMKSVLEETGFLRVRHKGSPLELPPGEVRAVDLDIRVPEGLDPRTRYFGSAAVYTNNLNFALVPVPGTPKSKRRRPRSSGLINE